MILCFIRSDTMKDAHIKAASEPQKGEKQIANLTLGGHAKEDSHHICKYMHARARRLASFSE